MKLHLVLAFLLVSASASVAQNGFDVTHLDTSVSPCTNFYQYACGNWLKNNPIPPDQSSWGRFDALHERNQRILQDILQTASAKSNKTSIEQKIGDYFGSCMDEKGIDAKGTEPLKPVLERIAKLPDKAALTAELIRLHRDGVGAMFLFSSGQDFKDATEMIANVDQGGLGMPERDYYFKTDPKSVELRQKYVAHVQKMFALLGDSSEKAAAKAKTVMTIETGLAKGSLDVTTRRDPSKIYHRMPLKELAAMAPSLQWTKYFEGIGTPPITTLNVAVPDFFKQLESILKTVSLEDWKVYLSWQALHAAAPLLPQSFVNENFGFYGKTLTGAKELRPRWKRCVQYTDTDLGEALGQKYVELTFGPQAKERMLKMVAALGRALEKDIKEIDWMTPETKKRALEKLHAISDKIGYPEKWREYTYDVKRGDALGNSFRANAFEFKRQIAKIGKPVDKKEWLMTPPTVNAYYDPQMNNINFPAGILQPPFYDSKLDDPVNFGAIGAVIGHEMTHGFDDQGRQFDAEGNLKDWWTASDAKEFEKRASCFEKQYGEYTVSEDLKLNGKLTLGENVADNGGLRIAYMGLVDVLGGKRDKKDGYTPEQRMFLGFAQIWCSNQTPEVDRLRAQTDPHSLPQYRVNGTVSNMPEFQKAFACAAGQPMVRAGNACRVW
jgi:endothelin-converting enzyme/putative endopeptidase